MEMNREYISEHNVVERYLMGRLSDEELAAFEERCLWDQEMLDELEAAEGLREGLRDFDAGAVQSAPRRPLARWLLSPQWAAAASVLLVVSLATTGRLLLTQGPGSTDGLATARVYSIEMMRTAGEPDVVLRVDPADRWVVLLVYPDLERHDRFQVSLHRKGEAEPLWQAKDIPPGRAESLAISLPAELLVPGNYHIRVQGLEAPGTAQPVGEVHFRVASGD
jgi:hypothetical protein